MVLPARLLLFALLGVAGPVAAATLTVPFDFSHHAIELDVMVKGRPLHMLLDTGIDPSVVDAARARALGFAIDMQAGGKASGEGHTRQAIAYPTQIAGLAIGGRAFAPFDALASDLTPMGEALGRPLDGILGYSFLRGRTVLIDYPRRTVSILDRPDPAPARACRRQWTIPLRFMKGEDFPVIPAFRFGTAVAQVSLDTGSSGNISIYRGTLKLPGVQAALKPLGTVKSTGANGDSISQTYRLMLPIGIGPFTLPPGQVVRLRDEDGGADMRLANVGNRIYDAMGLKLLLDYKGGKIGFFGECG